jgi:hypothetical protein
MGADRSSMRYRGRRADDAAARLRIQRFPTRQEFRSQHIAVALISLDTNGQCLRAGYHLRRRKHKMARRFTTPLIWVCSEIKLTHKRHVLQTRLQQLVL